MNICFICYRATGYIYCWLTESPYCLNSEYCSSYMLFGQVQQLHTKGAQDVSFNEEKKGIIVKESPIFAIWFLCIFFLQLSQNGFIRFCGTTSIISNWNWWKKVNITNQICVVGFFFQIYKSHTIQTRGQLILCRPSV